MSDEDRQPDEQLFSDMLEDADGFEVDGDSSDREILLAIWTQNEIGDLPADEAWAILWERYPDEPRFLLLNAYEEIMQPVSDAWTPEYFAKKAMQVLDGAMTLKPHVNDLVVTAWSVLFESKRKKKQNSLSDLITRLAISVKAEPTDDELSEAHSRMVRFSRRVVKEMHDKTMGGKPIAERPSGKTAGAKGVVDYAELIARGQQPPKKYAPDLKYDRDALIEHPKFGLGVVTGIETGRVEILFRDGQRKLVCGA